MARASVIRSAPDWLTHPLGVLGLAVTVAALLLVGWRLGSLPAMTLGMAAYAVPAAMVVIYRPVVAVYALVVVGFAANGLMRYVNFPLGLVVDGLLVLGWLVTLLRRFPRNFDTGGDDPRAWPELREDGFVMALIWFAYIVFELANSGIGGTEAWAYGMRSMGFYQVLLVGLTYFHVREQRQLRRVIHLILGLSVLGALWGIRQKFFFLDAAEEHWLFVEEHATQHILFGELRTFSFYSDAGQFGASQAMVFLMCVVLAIRPPSQGHRLWYVFAGALCFVGFGISGTRGALAVPAAGGLAYLVVSRNLPILLAGLVAMSASYALLRYTSVGSSVQQVQRMRTALDPNEPSLLVRLHNQQYLATQLADKPLGAGVGTSGSWGLRFAPATPFAQTPTDSYYVRMWVETGVVGLALHLLILGYLLGAGLYRVYHTVDDVLRHERAAFLCAFAGMLLASYGNAVYNQLPTMLLLAIGIPVMLWRDWQPDADT